MIMTIRKKCRRDGHKFTSPVGVPLPYVFCRRWRCGGSAVSIYARADGATAAAMHNAIPEAVRFPPVTMHPDGSWTVLPGREDEVPRG